MQKVSCVEEYVSDKYSTQTTSSQRDRRGREIEGEKGIGVKKKSQSHKKGIFYCSVFVCAARKPDIGRVRAKKRQIGRGRNDE